MWLGSCVPALLWLWLWYRPAATAPIRPRAWESPYAVGATLKRRQKKKKKVYLYKLKTNPKCKQTQLDLGKILVIVDLNDRLELAFFPSFFLYFQNYT